MQRESGGEKEVKGKYEREIMCTCGVYAYINIYAHNCWCVQTERLLPKVTAESSEGGGGINKTSGQ